MARYQVNGTNTDKGEARQSWAWMNLCQRAILVLGGWVGVSLLIGSVASRQPVNAMLWSSLASSSTRRCTS